jgi:hypothetical protein
MAVPAPIGDCAAAKPIFKVNAKSRSIRFMLSILILGAKVY